MKQKRYVPALAAMVLWLCSSVINAPGQTSSRDDELPRTANEIIGKVRYCAVIAQGANGDLQAEGWIRLL